MPPGGKRIIHCIRGNNDLRKNALHHLDRVPYIPAQS
ncbi:hypothetical protein BMETH_1585_0 [methanotrophic bacterial endosymbiont of Bathymodiolus sp.]|nr:hypothetical protein BMETH_1585_0 [methanotrophic bacterial endosymbiont of Bathymodiolus sp.]